MRFPNIFVNYPLGSMRVGDELWTNWNKAPLRLWQAQLKFPVFCASSASGVSSEYLNYAKHPMVAISISRVLSREKVLERYGFHCLTKPVLTLLTIIIPTKIFESL